MYVCCERAHNFHTLPRTLACFCMNDDFDEFGNYLGDEYSDSEGEIDKESQWSDDDTPSSEDEIKIEYHTHDMDDINDPLVKRQRAASYSNFVPLNWELHSAILKEAPRLVRNFAVVGDINHGKTSIVQNLLASSMTDLPLESDSSSTESQRKLTLKTTFQSTLVQDSHFKTHVFNISDTPGHPDFQTEVSAVSQICDGFVHVIDVLEGPVQNLYLGRPVVVVFNKIDRLILEHRLPPVHAFRKIKYMADELSVSLEKIIFASTKFNFSFTVHSMEELYRKYVPSAKEDFHISSEKQFVKYLLEPLYKIISCGLIGPKADSWLASLGIKLTPAEWELSVDPRISLIFGRFFETGFYALNDAIVKQIPSPLDSRMESEITVDTEATTTTATTINAININHSGEIYTVGRVISGVLHSNQEKDLWIPLGGEKTEVSQVYPGSWYMKHFEYNDTSTQDAPLSSVVKVGLESISNESSLDEGLRIISATYTGFHFSHCENGVRYALAPGELYLDTCLQSLASNGYKFHISQPFADFQESVSSESYAELPVSSFGNTIIIVARPFQKGVAENEFIWDSTNCNCYLTSLYPKEEYADSAVAAIIDGFRWFSNRGPLTEGTVRDIILKITELKSGSHHVNHLSMDTQHACSAAMLVATPCLMEPWFRVTVVGKLAAGKACYSEIEKRGGRITLDIPINGSNLYKTQGLVPVMDSFGLQSDILCQLDRHDAAKVYLEFDSWKTVSGDPLDPSCKAPRLKPATESSRAKDFTYKTRRLKGLNPEPQLSRYIDDGVKQAVN